eukprot:GEMP01025816.1.p1 GENE.GEMP01025816.1~~GEMP01025816.1.p1  ORF type:complete len:219 (+),score=65.95 GEMP01025816.1:99-755(+)
MGALFSSSRSIERKNKQNRVNETDKAILELKSQNDQLVVHKRKLEKLIPLDEDAARKLMRDKRDKKLILLALKKKKHHLALIDETQGHISKVQELISNVEMQLIHKNLTDALSTGVGALKELQKECSADYVAMILEENDEQREAVQEIGELLGQKGITDDDADIAAEYQQIEEMLGLAAASEAIDAMPVAPPNLPAIEPEAVAPTPADTAERAMEPAV